MELTQTPQFHEENRSQQNRGEVAKKSESEIVYRTTKGEKPRRVARLSKEGKQKATQEWQSLVTTQKDTESLPTLGQRVQKRIEELGQERSKRYKAKDQKGATAIRLLERSLEMRLANMKRQELSAQLSSANSPWKTVQEQLTQGIYQGLPPKFAENAVTAYIQKVRKSFEPTVATLDPAKQTSALALYDTKIAAQVLSELGKREQEAGGAERLQKEKLKAVTTTIDLAAIQQSVLEAVQSQKETVQPVTEVLAKLGQAEKMKKPGKFAAAMKFVPPTLRRAVVAAALGGYLLNAQAVQPLVGLFEAKAHSPAPIVLQQEKQPLPAIAEAAVMIPPPNPVVIVDRADVVSPIKNERLSAEEEIKKLLKQQSPQREQNSKVENNAPKPIEVTEKTPPKEKVKQEKLGLRVTEPDMIPVAKAMGVDALRVAGNATTIGVDGQLEDKSLEAMLQAADANDMSVLAVFSPNTLPPFDNEATVPKSLEEFKQHEGKIKKAIKDRLTALLKHKAIKTLEIGNEPNDNEHFWQHKGYKEFAYFVKSTMDVMKDMGKDKDLDIVLGAIAEPGKNPQAFTAYMQALKEQGIDVRGMQIAFHGYTQNDVEAGIRQIESVGGIAIGTEVGVDRRHKDAAARLQKVVQTSLQKAKEIFVHEFTRKNTTDFSGAEYSVTEGSPMAETITTIAKSLKPQQERPTIASVSDQQPTL